MPQTPADGASATPAAAASRFAWPLAMVALGLVGAAWWLWPRASADAAHPPSGDEARQGAGTQRAVAAPRARTGCTFAAGEAVVWQLSIAHKLEVDAEALLPFGARRTAPGLRPMQLPDLALQLSAVALAATDAERGTVLALRLRDRSSTPAPDQPATLQTFLLRMGPDCAMEALARHKDAELAGALAQQRVMLALQWSLPRAEEPDRFTRVQRDGLGRLEARQVLASGPAGATLQRRVLRYTDVHRPGQTDADRTSGAVAAVPAGLRGPTPRVEIARNLTRVTLGQGPWCEALESESDLTVFEGTTPSLHDQAEIRLQRATGPEAAALAQQDAAAVASIDVEAYVWGDLFGVDVEAQGHAAIVPGLQGMATAQALLEFRRLHSDPSARRPGDMLRFLQQWLQANPDQADALIAAIKAGELEGELATLALLALKMAGTPQARRALRSAMLDAELDPHLRSSALFGLADMDDLDAADFDTLRALSRRTHQGPRSERELVESAATLAIGMLGNPNLGHSPALAATARQELLDQLATATEPTLVSDLLEGVGNAGETSMLPAVTAHIDAEAQPVRLSAAHALRMMEPTATEQTFATWLGAEADAEVRAELVKSMVGQLAWHGVQAPATVVSAAVQTLQAETAPTVVRSLVALLGPASASDASARDALVALFHRSKDDQVLVQIGSHVAPKWLQPSGSQGEAP